MRRRNLLSIDRLFAVLLSFSVLLALGTKAMLPTPEARQVAVVFAPWVSPSDAMSQIIANDAFLVRQGSNAHVWVIDLGGAKTAADLNFTHAFLANPRVTGSCGSVITTPYSTAL